MGGWGRGIERHFYAYILNGWHCSLNNCDFKLQAFVYFLVSDCSGLFGHALSPSTYIMCTLCAPPPPPSPWGGVSVNIYLGSWWGRSCFGFLGETTVL